MTVRSRPARGRLGTWLTLGILLAALPLGAAAPARAAYPGLPLALDIEFLTGLGVPSLAPGASGTLFANLTNPLPSLMTAVVLGFEVYSFVAYPGNTSSPPPLSSPALAGGNRVGSPSVYSLASLGPGTTLPVPLTVSVPSGAASGAYLVRVSLAFDANGSSYLLESRGYFSPEAWANATGPNGSVEASRLGVSGVLPETAVPVRSNAFPLVLYPLLGASLVLAGLGGYYAFGRGPKSSAGARLDSPPQRAPRAFGKRRKREGD